MTKQEIIARVKTNVKVKCIFTNKFVNISIFIRAILLM